MVKGWEWGIAERPTRGETESGDRHLIRAFPEGLLVAVIDGLGHGHEAAMASDRAIAHLKTTSHLDVSLLLRGCHQVLRETRGAVMTLATITRDSLTWLGVGNVEGILIRPGSRIYVTQRGGIVGHELPFLSPSTVPLTVGDTLLFATDGLANDLSSAFPHLEEESPQPAADYLLSHFGKDSDDALVLVGRYQEESAS